MAFATTGTEAFDQEFEHAADAFRHQQHYREQQQAVEEIAELRQRRNHLGKRSQHDGADGGPEDVAAAADDDADEEEQAEVEYESVRRDVALQHREQRARDAGGKPAENEHSELRTKHRHADRLRGHGAVAHRDQAASPGMARNIPGEPGHQHGDGEDQPVSPSRRIERGWKSGNSQSDAAAGEIALRQRDLGDDQRERQRGHREIESGQSQRRQAEQESTEGAQGAGCRDGDGRMHTMRACENGKTIRTDCQQPDVADRELPRIADHEVQSADQHPVSADQRGKMQFVEIARPPRQRDQRRRD